MAYEHGNLNLNFMWFKILKGIENIYQTQYISEEDDVELKK